MRAEPAWRSVSGTRAARATGRAASISLLAHTCLGFAVWAGAEVSDKVVIPEAGPGEGGVISVSVQQDDSLAEQPSPHTDRGSRVLPAKSAAATTPPAPVARGPRRVPSLGSLAASASTATGFATAEVQAPPVRPIRVASKDAVPADRRGALGDVGVESTATAPSAPGFGAQEFAAEGRDGHVEMTPDSVSTDAPPVAPTHHTNNRAWAPVFLPAEVARYLRSSDSFPSLPNSLRRRGAHYLASLEICVARDGRVSDVGFNRNSAPDLDTVLGAAVRGWRYRPFVVDGRAAPFCHRLTVTYEMQ